jgi:hypothetical protein
MSSPREHSLATRIFLLIGLLGAAVVGAGLLGQQATSRYGDQVSESRAAAAAA